MECPSTGHVPNFQSLGLVQGNSWGRSNQDGELIWKRLLHLITSYHLGTNISPPKVCLKMIFLFARVKLLDGHSTAHIATKQNIPQRNFACHVSGGRVDE